MSVKKKTDTELSTLCAHVCVCKEHVQIHSYLGDGKVHFLDPGTHAAKTLFSLIWMTPANQTL